MRKSLLTASMPALAMVIALAGCAGVAGTLRRDAATTELFEKAEIIPGHTYYWSGVEAEPDGIVAVDNAFTLKTELWNEFDPANGKLKEMVGQMRLRGTYTSEFNFGSIIHTDDGKRVGVWFSRADWTKVVMHDENIVEITTPGKLIKARERGRGSIWGR